MTSLMIGSSGQILRQFLPKLQFQGPTFGQNGYITLAVSGGGGGIRRGDLTRAVSPAQMWAKWLHNPSRGFLVSNAARTSEVAT